MAKERAKKAAGKKAAGKRAAGKKARRGGSAMPPGSDPPETSGRPPPAALPGLPSVERLSAAMRGPGGDRDAVARAQELVYEAWESTPRRASALAKQALRISEDCADAYCLLARDAKTLAEATRLYQMAVAAGERAIGKQAFDDDVGHFWGLLETRPYMRARAALADSLWAAGERAEAVGHYRDMLRLNPGDNQGLRYVLMECLLQMGAWEEAESLHEEHAEDAMATWAYSRALLDFRRGGDTETARQALREALAVNAHVPAYLLGERKVPRVLPAYHGLGDENEAILYAARHASIWVSFPGALAWLREAIS
jgi:tetratricopeptide (TPR) repeat protein